MRMRILFYLYDIIYLHKIAQKNIETIVWNL